MLIPVAKIEKPTTTPVVTAKTTGWAKQNTPIITSNIPSMSMVTQRLSRRDSQGLYRIDLRRIQTVFLA